MSQRHTKASHKPSKAQVAIAHAQIAGYHDDSTAFTRLRIESRVSLTTLETAWLNGRSMKDRGVVCGCPDCRRAAAPVPS